MPDELPDIHLMSVNPVKRSVQLHLLGLIKGAMVKKGLGAITVACLPGEGAWDIDYFLQWKEVGYIVGIERDEEIATKLRERFKGNSQVEIFTGSVAEWLMNADFKVDLIYLDYCSQFSLSVIQDIDIMLRRRILPIGGRCVISFFNAREGASSRIARHLLFDEMDAFHSSGEEWKALNSDRKRCIAFNALLHRYRSRHTNPLVRVNDQKQQYRLIGTSAVHQWHRYKTVGGSMLTGFFTLRAYGDTTSRYVVKACPDKWYVRGKYSIKDAKLQKALGALGRVERKMGREFYSDFLKKKVLTFYKEHGYPPTKMSARSPRPGWHEFVREIGLCPREGATLKDIKRELQNIYVREGIVQRADIQRAKLFDRGVVRRQPGQAIEVFGRLLRGMAIPHDLRTPREKVFPSLLKKWIQHLESESGRRSHGPHYSCMFRRGLLEYEDAVKELRRLENAAETAKQPDA